MNKKLIKNITAVSAAFAIVLTGFTTDFISDAYNPFSTVANATTAKEKKAQAEENLANVQNQISNIENSVTQVENQIASNKSQLNTLLDQQEQLKQDINDKQAEIDQCSKDLEKANEDADEEYRTMCLRVKYTYENGSSMDIFSLMLGSQDFSDMLNKLDYASSIYSADQDLTAKYEAAVKKQEELGVKLAGEMDDLNDLQEEYNQKQAKLESVIASLKAQESEYASELARAKAQANEYKTVISQQAEIIRQQEAAAARAAAETYTGGGSDNGGGSTPTYVTDGNSNPDPVTGVSGQSIVDFAMQYVGGKYVWGGNSLTEGVDCSGFVHLVYAHFGISTPRYSQSFASVGQAVSLSNIQPGDVVVYPGHVAIYAGGGVIVEAQSTKAGITCARSVNCHKITAIRRLV